MRECWIVDGKISGTSFHRLLRNHWRASNKPRVEPVNLDE